MIYRMCVTATVTLLLIGVTPTFGQAAAGKATFNVRVIAASKGAVPKMDPRLAGMERELKAFERRYNCFALVRDQSMVLTVNAIGTVALVKRESFVVQLLGILGTRIRYQARFARTRTTRSVAPGGRAIDILPRDGAAIIVSTIAHL